MKRAVLGLGNLLLGDEGVGVHAARALSASGTLPNVDVVDVGTAILDAIPTLERADRIVVIDAVCGGEAPGTVYLMNIDDVSPSPVIGSMHGFDLCRVLSLCRRTDRPEVVVVGVEPDRIDWSMELSPAVESALPAVLDAVRGELGSTPGAAPGLEEDDEMHAMNRTTDDRSRRTRARAAGALAALAILACGQAVAAPPAAGPPGGATARPHAFAADLRTLAAHPAPEPLPASPKAGVDGIGALVTAEGIGFSGAFPADTVGAVGAGRYLQLVSGRPSSLLTVMDSETAAVLAGPVTLSDVWTGGGACSEGWGEPGVVFDALADRWVITERGAGNHLCVYVSQSDDPVAGGWFGYDIATPRFPDQPRLAAWPQAFVVTTNESVPAVYVLERSAMLAGQAAAWQRFEAPPLAGFGSQSLTPARLSVLADTGPTPPPVVGRQADGQAHGGVDRLEVWEVQVDWQAPSSAGLLGPATVATGSFDSDLCGLGPAPCIPQPGAGPSLDPVKEALSSLELAVFDDHLSLVGSFAVDADGSDRAGIRWFELRSTGGSWSVHDEGLHAPGGSHRWLPAAAVDRQGNLAVVANASDPAGDGPSVRLAGRHADDAASALPIGEIELRTGDGPQTAGLSPERWGSWSSLVVDSDDGCTFWATAPYTLDGSWSTVVARFAFDGCGDAPSDVLFADDFESGTTGAWTGASP